MNHTVLQQLKYFGLGMGLLVAVTACKSVKSGNDTAQGNPPEVALGWKLGSQAYTFNRFTFAEAIDKIDSCNLRYVEAFPGQRIGGGIEGKMEPGMSEETRKAVLSLLKSKDVQLIALELRVPATKPAG